MKVSKYSIIFIIVIFVILVIIILNITRYFDKIEEFITLYGSSSDYTGKYNTTCKKCTDCPAGEYKNGCNGLNTGSCTPCTACPIGEYNSGCTGTIAGSCIICPNCPTGEYNSGCTGTIARECTPCTACPTGEYNSGCIGTIAGECTACTTCPTGEYNSGCTGTIAGECTACTACPTGEYNSGCTGTIAGSCIICPDCPSNQHRIGCTGTTTGTCINNTCTCTYNGTNAGNGATPSSGDQYYAPRCTTNGANICGDCYDGWHLNTDYVGNYWCAPHLYVYDSYNYAFSWAGDNNDYKMPGVRRQIVGDKATFGGTYEIGNDSISSIKNPKGHSVSLYKDSNFDGLCTDFTSSVPNLSYHMWSDGSSMNNSVSSIKVGKTCADG